MNSKQTSKKIATLSSETLKSKLVSARMKRLAWSDLSQTNTNKETSTKMAKEASKTLKDKLSSAIAKKLAWSNLSQAKGKKTK